MQKKVLYWSPHINKNVATVKAVLNSAKSLEKYSDNYDVNIINVFGEWEFCKKNNKEISFIDLYLSKKLSLNKDITGFVKSRLTYLLIGLFSIIPLYKLLKKDKPDYLVVHLLTFIY